MKYALQLPGREIALDKHGYLLHLQDWDETVATALAEQENLRLSAAHWELISLLRNFHGQSGLIPSTRVLVRLMARELGEDKGKSAYLMRLFPQTPLKLLCKIAGLPRPTNCI